MFFSIVVASLNAESLIKNTIDSVLMQTFDDYEIIVKDGMSTDKTIENIPDSDKISVYAMKDKNVYDAMNQAIPYCKGRFILFLNCGDNFASENVLESVYNLVKDEKEPCIVYGNLTKGGVFKKQPSSLSAFTLYRNSLCHQTMFVHRDVFELCGKYNIEYGISADYEHTVHSYFKGVRFIYTNTVIADYLPGGLSETENGLKVRKAEYKKIRKTYYDFLSRIMYDLILFLSMKKLRIYIASDKSPAFLRNLYRKAVNKIN